MKKIKYPNNILFVDIDGCMTSMQDETYFNSDDEKYHISETILKRVVDFCKENKAKVVITSNWRKFDVDGVWTYKGHTFKNPISEFIKKLGRFYFGTLPLDRHIRKSEALILWFEDNDFKGNFVIFDDDLRENYQNTTDDNINKHFVFVDYNFGITEELLEKAKSILSKTV